MEKDDAPAVIPPFSTYPLTLNNSAFNFGDFVDAHKFSKLNAKLSDMTD